MELGLHRRDFHKHLLRNEKPHTEVTTLLWSIMVLDRQWSAATGLPQNFQESDFDQAMEPPVRIALYYRFLESGHMLQNPRVSYPWTLIS